MVHREPEHPAEVRVGEHDRSVAVKPGDTERHRFEQNPVERVSALEGEQPLALIGVDNERVDVAMADRRERVLSDTQTCLQLLVARICSLMPATAGMAEVEPDQQLFAV